MPIDLYEFHESDFFSIFVCIGVTRANFTRFSLESGVPGGQFCAQKSRENPEKGAEIIVRACFS